jgi:hypothetical protein
MALALSLATVLATEGERPVTATVRGLYGLYLATPIKPFKATFELTTFSHTGEVVVPVSGSAACPKGCPVANDPTGGTDVTVIPEGDLTNETLLVAFFRCICNAPPGPPPPPPFLPDTGCAPACPAGSLCCRDPAAPPPGTCFTVSNCSQLPGRGFRAPRAANPVSPPIVVSIGLKSLSVKTVATLSSAIFDNTAIGGCKIGYYKDATAGPTIVQQCPFSKNASDPFSPNQQRFVAINPTTGNVKLLFDKFHFCPRQPGEPPCNHEQYAALTGFGVSVPAHGDDHPPLWLDNFIHYDKDYIEYPGILQLGLRMPDGEVALNGSHNLGMWSLASKPALDPAHVAAIGLAACCDPATVSPCPVECAGTVGTPRMVLVSFEDIIHQPANFTVEWAGTLDEAAIFGSLTSGGAYDAVSKVYYHAAVLNSSKATLRTTASPWVPLRPASAGIGGPSGEGILRFALSAKPAKLLSTWVLSSAAPLALRFQP